MKEHKHLKTKSPENHARNGSETVRFHKDRRVWLGVGLMLLAMLVYVLTLDESLLPPVLRQ